MSMPDFDRIAHAYRWLEYLSFGPLLQRCRTEHLEKLMSARRALVLGDGDGRFTSKLLATNGHITIDAVDASAAMLSLLREKACAQNAQSRVTLQQRDIRCFSPQGKYDVIISHFFLDCLSNAELRALIRRVKPCLASEALWVVSEFAVPPAPWHNRLATLLISSLYFAFGWLTGLGTRHLPDYATILTAEGFVLNKERQRLGGVLVSQLWQLEHSHSEV
jgi:cyclopropane fatty-acyl-phospholipid synthase-like methyltransferase